MKCKFCIGETVKIKNWGLHFPSADNVARILRATRWVPDEFSFYPHRVMEREYFKYGKILNRYIRETDGYPVYLVELTLEDCGIFIQTQYEVIFGELGLESLAPKKKNISEFGIVKWSRQYARI